MRIDRLQVKEQMAYPVGFYVRNSHFQETASYRGVSVWECLVFLASDLTAYICRGFDKC